MEFKIGDHVLKEDSLEDRTGQTSYTLQEQSWQTVVPEGEGCVTVGVHHGTTISAPLVSQATKCAAGDIQGRAATK